MATITIDECVSATDEVTRTTTTKGISLYDALEQAGFIEGGISRDCCAWYEDSYECDEDDADSLCYFDDRGNATDCYYHVYVE